MSKAVNKKRNRKPTSWTGFDIQRLSTFPAVVHWSPWSAHQAALKWMFFAALAALFAFSYFADWDRISSTSGGMAIPPISVPLEQNSAGVQADDLGQTPTSQGATAWLVGVFSLFRSGELGLSAVQGLGGGPWGYVFLAVLVAIEGPIATLLGAAAAATSALSLPWVFVAATIGNLTADIIWYWVGRSGRLDRVARYARWIRLKPEQVYLLSSQLEQNTTRVLFVAKITAGLVIPTLIAAGLIRAPWRRWFLPVFAGETLWTGALIVLGYYATSLLFQVERTIGYIIVGGSVLFFLAIVYAVRRTLRRGNASH